MLDEPRQLPTSPFTLLWRPLSLLQDYGSDHEYIDLPELTDSDSDDDEPAPRVYKAANNATLLQLLLLLLTHSLAGSRASALQSPTTTRFH